MVGHLFSSLTHGCKTSYTIHTGTFSSSMPSSLSSFRCLRPFSHVANAGLLLWGTTIKWHLRAWTGAWQNWFKFWSVSSKSQHGSSKSFGEISSLKRNLEIRRQAKNADDLDSAIIHQINIYNERFSLKGFFFLFFFQSTKYFEIVTERKKHCNFQGLLSPLYLYSSKVIFTVAKLYSKLCEVHREYYLGEKKNDGD